ncbi:adenylate/guanylate cyclase domain-containing protein [Mesorhizobium koreense]|uniref:adenylate/guanylate cyclase domain-containing protein n=1 Tax=Mesorhizobium koreense TaxID=3074855 RepID=UPI00287B8798|nr:adenylate/guanylate cyclase domain-containing protein [Mesorhizobium sp. WR6]
MSETADLIAILRQSADEKVAVAIGRLIDEGLDRHLCRINALAFAERNGFDQEKTIAAFLHAASIGLFDISWNVLCPGCGGVLDTNTTLKTMRQEEYVCSLCAAGYEPTLDEMVEVTFTVSPRIRRIAAHNPEELPPLEYFRQVYWSSGVDLPEEGYTSMVENFIVETVELPPGEKAILSIQLPEEFVVVFEPMTHSVQFLDVKGEPTRERQALSVIIDREHLHNQALEMHPGPLRVTFENRTDHRALPSVFIAGEELHRILRKRRPFLTAKRLLTNQTFRDLYRTDIIEIDQRLKITSLTFLFTDLRGSTELYERVGDLAAFDIVRAHFRVLTDIVAAEAGAVVKTIGDAVMATFPAPDRAVAAALKMRKAMRDLNAERGREDLLLKIGIHEGPCIAVSMNERQDYFGQTVNIASRVQGLATSQSIFATNAVISDARAAEVLDQAKVTPVSKGAMLRGVASEMPLYAIP